MSRALQEERDRLRFESYELSRERDYYKKQADLLAEALAWCADVARVGVDAYRKAQGGHE